MPTFQAEESEFVHQCDSCGRDATFLDLIRHHAIWVCRVCYHERTACAEPGYFLGTPQGMAEKGGTSRGVAEEVARDRRVYDGGPRIEF